MTLKYPCCEHCAEVKIHDVDLDDHEVPCGLCSREVNASPTREVQRLTAEVERMRTALLQWMDSYVKMQQAGHEEMTRADYETRLREDVADEYQKACRSWDTQRARLDATIAERDAMRERVRALCNEGHGYLSTGRVRAAIARTL
jgi:hypothetical protein